MKYIDSAAGSFGPFTTIEVGEDRLIADGAHYCFDVIGAYTIADRDPPPPVAPSPEVPQSVTMRQARLALLGAGKLSAVDAAIASLPSPQKEAAQIEWEFSSTVERNRPLVQTLGPALGLSESDLDQLFITAATL
jgi:hypothetical protein